MKPVMGDTERLDTLKAQLANAEDDVRSLREKQMEIDQQFVAAVRKRNLRKRELDSFQAALNNMGYTA